MAATGSAEAGRGAEEGEAVIPKEEIEQFLRLQQRIHAAAMALLEAYCSVKHGGNRSQWIDQIDSVTEDGVEFYGWDGSDPVSVNMPLRYLHDITYHQRLVDDAEEKMKAAVAKRKQDEEKKQAETEARERQQYERLRQKFEVTS